MRRQILLSLAIFFISVYSFAQQSNTIRFTHSVDPKETGYVLPDLPFMFYVQPSSNEESAVIGLSTDIPLSYPPPKIFKYKGKKYLTEEWLHNVSSHRTSVAEITAKFTIEGLGELTKTFSVKEGGWRQSVPFKWNRNNYSKIDIKKVDILDVKFNEEPIKSYATSAKETK